MTAPASTPTEVLVRVDAGRRIGSGHVARSLTVARHLRERGAATVVAAHCDDVLAARIEDEGHTLLHLGHLEGRRADAPDEIWPADDQDADAARVLEAHAVARPRRPDVVLVDHYGLDRAWERHAAPARVVVIDDLANRPHEAAVVTDQNWYGPHTADRYRTLVPPACRLLLGPTYALLQPDYRALPSPTARRGDRIGRVVVSFGGTDASGETAKVVRAFADPDLADVELTVVVGHRAAATEELADLVAGRPHTELHVEVPSLAPFLAGNDLAIGASGMATWERMAAGIPAVVATVAPHQSGVTQALDEAGLTRWIGLTADTTVDGYRRAVRELLDGPPTPPPPVVDGFGALRVAAAVLGTTGAWSARRAGPADAAHCLPFVPAADGSVPDMLDGPDVWRHQHERFTTLLADPTVAVWQLEVDGVPAGCALVDGDAGPQVGLAAFADDPAARRRATELVASTAATEHAPYTRDDP